MPAAPTHPLVRAYLRLRPTWSPHHRRIAVSALNRWHAFCTARGVDVVAAGREDCADFIAARAGAVAGSTAHKDWQHLRWFYAWLVDDGELDDQRQDRRGARVGPMRGVQAPKVNDPDPARTGHVTAGDYQRLLASFGKRTVRDTRNAAICSLLYWAGLRRSEIVRADVERLDLDEGTLDILGKNGRWRTVALTTETTILLERYLRRRGDDPSPALFASTKTDEGDGRMHPNAISLMLARRCADLGIKASPHMFRRAMAIHSSDRGMPELAICTTAGWDDPRMLKRYTREVLTRQAIAAVRALDPTAPRAQARRRLRAIP